MLNQKEKEKLAVEKYLEVSEQIFEIEEFESPDFVLINNRFRIGCEVTDFFPDYSSKGSDVQKRAKFVDKLHQNIRNKILESFPVGYSITIQYRPIMDEKSDVSKEVEIIMQKLNENMGTRPIDQPSINVRRIFFRKNDSQRTKVKLQVLSKYQEPCSEWIQTIIDYKTNLISNWNGSWDKKWLLISIGLDRASDLNLNLLLTGELTYEPWDKIILFDFLSSEYLELNAV